MSETVAQLREEIRSKNLSIAELEHELAALRDPQSIDVDTSMRDAPFAMPSRRQFQKLYAAACATLPGPAQGVGLEDFALACWWIGASDIEITDDNLDERHYAIHWTQMAGDWLVSHGRSATITVPVLLLAACAMRAPYRLASTAHGSLAAFGFHVGHRSGDRGEGGAWVVMPSRRCGNAWLDTIRDCRGLDPLAPPRLPPASPAQVQQLSLARHFDDAPMIREL